MRQTKVLAVLQAILSTCFVCGTLASAQGSPDTTKTPEKPHFSYSGDDGPGFWAEISPEWEACGNTEQSPVDIPGNAEVDPTLTLTLDLKQTSVEMFNDGHTIKVEYKNDTGGTITFNNVVYEVRQFHFHTLSEHTFQGNRGVMELHAVFQKEKTPNYVAIAMLYEMGNANPFLSTLISAGLPQKSFSKRVPIPALDLANAFTEISSYYNYAGSHDTSLLPRDFYRVEDRGHDVRGAVFGLPGNHGRQLPAHPSTQRSRGKSHPKRLVKNGKKRV